MSAFSAALTGKQILVVEDEYLLAQDIAAALRRRGAAVLGPVATIQAAADLIARQRIDAAVLDVNLQGDLVYPVADALTERNVPYVFATGYDRAALPSRYSHIPLLQKPIEATRIASLLFDRDAVVL
jgi:CheY-like chemotaxis protein